MKSQATLYRTGRFFTVLLGLLALSGARAQEPAAQDFAAFARDQNKRLVQLYERRDAVEYGRVLDRWLARYRQLPDAKQQMFRPQLANAYYNFACTYALLGQQKPALDQLALAIGAGYGNYAHMQRDTDLDGLRKEPRFLQLLEPLRATAISCIFCAAAAGMIPTTGAPSPLLPTSRPAMNGLPPCVQLTGSIPLPARATMCRRR